jgi:hypothetical protein
LIRSYFPKPEGQGLREITLLKFDKYGHSFFRKDIMVLLYCTEPHRRNKEKLMDMIYCALQMTCTVLQFTFNTGPGWLNELGSWIT